ncbi:unnamed protein product [Sphagnum balticum]
MREPVLKRALIGAGVGTLPGAALIAPSAFEYVRHHLRHPSDIQYLAKGIGSVTVPGAILGAGIGAASGYLKYRSRRNDLKKYKLRPENKKSTFSIANVAEFRKIGAKDKMKRKSKHGSTSFLGQGLAGAAIGGLIGVGSSAYQQIKLNDSGMEQNYKKLHEYLKDPSLTDEEREYGQDTIRSLDKQFEPFIKNGRLIRTEEGLIKPNLLRIHGENIGQGIALGAAGALTGKLIRDQLNKNKKSDSNKRKR